MNLHVPLKLGILGITGRMGRAIHAQVQQEHPSLFYVVGGTSYQSTSTTAHLLPLDDLVPQCDVIVDFSHPDALKTHLTACLTWKKPLVMGTTGLSHQQQEQLKVVAKVIPILLASNTSLGIVLLRHLISQAIAHLQPYDPQVDIHDIHHKHKEDAPSGTAISLAHALLKGQDIDGANIPWFIPTREAGQEYTPRPPHGIGLSTQRIGECPGTHTVTMAWGQEMLTLTHTAHDRNVFANGALKAAEWLVRHSRDVGRVFSMEDVLNLRSVHE